MSKKNSKKHQKLYKMKGCSKTRKNYLGGNKNLNITNPFLAYPSNTVPTVPNPFLAYTGKGGSSNIYPSTGPVPRGDIFLNPQTKRGGGCGCGIPLMMGGMNMGGSCSLCNTNIMSGGTHNKHRIGCKCSTCKMKGGNNLSNNGIPYPDGLVGQPYTPDRLPGTTIPGNSNYYKLNTYPVDPQTAMISTGANPPFSIGGKGKIRTKKQKGGALSNFMFQDLINLGRQFNYGLGSAYNALSGYPAPVNPLPWKGQLPTSSKLNTI